MISATHPSASVIRRGLLRDVVRVLVAYGRVQAIASCWDRLQDVLQFPYQSYQGDRLDRHEIVRFDIEMSKRRSGMIVQVTNYLSCFRISRMRSLRW